MTSSKQADYFDTEAKKNIKDWFRQQTFADKQEFEIFFKFLALPAGSRLFELGCGTGRYTLLLLAKGYSVYAVDISKQSLEVLKEEYNKNKNSTWGSLEISTSMVTDRIFDGAVCVNILHHVDSPKKVIKNLIKIIRKGGPFIAFEPNPFCPFWHLYFLYKGIWRLEKGILNTSQNNLKRIFSEVGLKNISIIKYGLIPTRWLGLTKNKYLFDFLTLKLPKIPFLGIICFHHLIKGIKQ